MTLFLLAFLTAADITISGPHPSGNDQAAIQAAVDAVAASGGGRVWFEPGHYRFLTVTIPWTPDLRYSNIQLRGKLVDGKGPVKFFTARTVAPVPGEQSPPLVNIAPAGWQWDGPKLTGIVVSGIEFEGRNAAGIPVHNTLLTVGGCDGAIVEKIRLIGSRAEAFISAGATGAKFGIIRDSFAQFCGRPQFSPTSQPLAGFNVNSYAWKGERLVAVDCGHGIECGGTGNRFTDCLFVRAQALLGSAGCGSSNNHWTRCTWVDCSAAVSNGIGPLADVRFLNCNFIRGGFGFAGSRDVYSVHPSQYGGMPLATTGPIQIAGCRFIGGDPANVAIRIANWHDLYDHGPDILVKGCTFLQYPNQVLIAQTRLARSKVTFDGNDFCGSTQIGIVYAHLPDSTRLPPIPATQFVFLRNKAETGARIVVSGAPVNSGWPAEYPLARSVGAQ